MACDHINCVVIVPPIMSWLEHKKSHYVAASSAWFATLCNMIWGSVTSTPTCDSQVYAVSVTTLSCWLYLPKEAFLAVFHSHANPRLAQSEPMTSNKDLLCLVSVFFLDVWHTVFCQRKLLPEPHKRLA